MGAWPIQRWTAFRSSFACLCGFMYDTVTIYSSAPCDFSVLMLRGFALPPGATPGRPVVDEVWSASLHKNLQHSYLYNIFKQASADFRTTLHTASTPTDSAGHEFLYKYSQSVCLCLDGDPICAMELLMVLKAGFVYSFSGIHDAAHIDPEGPQHSITVMHHYDSSAQSSAVREHNQTLIPDPVPVVPVISPTSAANFCQILPLCHGVEISRRWH